MIWLSLIISKLLLINADGNLKAQYCSIRESSCNKTTDHLDNLSEDKAKFLFYDVNSSEGFNLRREVYMRFAVLIAEAQKSNPRNNWHLVLPPWHGVHHWNQQMQYDPMPWNSFFDIKSLKAFAPVMEMFETFTILPTRNDKLVIDVVFVMQRSKQKHYLLDKQRYWEVNEVRVKGDDKDVEKIKDKEGCEYNGEFWGYKNISAREIICVTTTGEINMLWDILHLRPWSSTVMIANSQLLSHEAADNFDLQNSFWECRESMKFSPDLQAAAEIFMRNYLDCSTRGCTTYISVHWRQHELPSNFIVPKVNNTIAQIHQFITTKCPSIKKVFIASDATEDDLNFLERKLVDFGYKVYQNSSSKYILANRNEGRISIVDQIICSRAAYFIGTQHSTFTFRIQEERDILGFAPKTTYNRLCLDQDNCTLVFPVVTKVNDQYDRVCI